MPSDKDRAAMREELQDLEEQLAINPDGSLSNAMRNRIAFLEKALEKVRDSEKK